MLVATCVPVMHTLAIIPTFVHFHTQVFWTVTVELVKFSVVIFIVMLGFAMSFHALFGNVESFGVTCLHLFKGLLGDADFFDEFSGGRYDAVASFLFCVYLVVIAVMLLNLLIAVLSTSHSRIAEKADQEFRVSKVLLIEHYRLVVGKQLLPPPFNLLQLVIVTFATCLFAGRWTRRREACARAKEAVGRLAFWLVLGPIAAVGGALLWVVSALHACIAWSRYYHRNASQSSSEVEVLSVWWRALRYIVIFAWCVVGAPMLLVAFWLTAPLRWIMPQPWGWLWDNRHPICTRRCRPMSANEMLRTPRGGLAVSDIQKYLDDPLSGLEVRQDEKPKHATVEHMKLVLDHLDQRLSVLEKSHERIVAKLDDLFASLDRFDERGTVRR